MNLQIEKFSFIKYSKYYKFLRDIIIPFGLKIISRLIRGDVDEDLIIMGAYGGNMYFDNTRALFEFLSEHSNYRVVWMAKSKTLIKKLKKEGYNAIYSLNFNAIRLLRKAKFIFITHGIYDLLPIEISPNTTVILTWHGTPIKKIVLDQKDKYYLYTKWGHIFKLKLRYDQYINYILTPTTGNLEHKVLCSAFKVPLNKITNLGYPRHDMLFNADKEFINSLKKKHNISDKYNRVILYCPTFRDFQTSIFRLTDQDLNYLNRMLEKTNSLFLSKGHLFGSVSDYKGYPNIRTILKDVDIHELYTFTDVLITDYSSTMLDFSLLDRPILLFPYDLEDYKRKRGMYYELQDIAPGPILKTFEELIEALMNIDIIEEKFGKKRKIIRDRFNKYVDGNSTKRILDFLNIKYT